VAEQSSIEWTDATWNPVTGCTKISQGCKFCYAERLATRLQAMGQDRYRNAFALTLHPDLVELPLRWRRPRTIFVNSMSDLFHQHVPAHYIKRVFEVMREARWHRFQVLTKRSGRLRELSPWLPWPENVWMGVSVESAAQLGRIDDLRQVPAAVRFLSVEPLLGPIPRIPLRGIDWVIVGGESGPRCRAMEPDWARQIRDACARKGVPFFFKQWGGRNKKKSGRVLDGRFWDEMPSPQSRWSPSAVGEVQKQRAAVGG
jgi:protein gp37